MQKINIIALIITRGNSLVDMDTTSTTKLFTDWDTAFNAGNEAVENYAYGSFAIVDFTDTNTNNGCFVAIKNSN